MTLLLQSCFSDSEAFGDGFVVSTSDTRSVYREFDPLSLNFNSGIKMSREVSDKSIKLSNNVILCAGGIESVTELWKSFMVECSEDEFHLDEMIPIMEESLLFLTTEANSDDFIRKHIFTDSVSLRLVGFFRNGNTGILGIESDGTIKKFELLPDHYQSFKFVPTQDILDIIEALMDFNQFDYGAEDMLTHVVNHLLYCHALIASQETETVSSACIVHVLAKVNGEIVHNKFEVDLTETIEEIKKVS